MLNQNGFYAEEVQPNNLNYYHLGININPSTDFKLYLGASHLIINKTKRGEFNFDQTGVQESLIDYKINQDEFYAAGIFQNEGFKISPVLHYIKVNYNLPYFEIAEDEYSFSSELISLNQYVGSLSLSWHANHFSYDIYASYSNLNYANQIQIGAFLYFYPLGNLNFYTGTGVKLFTEKYELIDYSYSSVTDARFIFNQLIGFKLSNKLWGETSFTYGDLQNTNEKNAFIVYNTINNIKLKASLAFVLTLNKHLGLSLRYQIEQRNNSYYVFNDESNMDNYNAYTYRYYTNNLIGGLTWKF